MRTVATEFREKFNPFQGGLPQINGTQLSETGRKIIHLNYTVLGGFFGLFCPPGLEKYRNGSLIFPLPMSETGKLEWEKCWGMRRKMMT